MSKKKSKKLTNLTQTLRILGDEKRLKILLLIREEEKNVTGLCKILKMPQPSVSRHLGILRMGGIAVNRREGKRIYYQMSDLSGIQCGDAIEQLLEATAAELGY
jgi:ArsR family transcriptional regulator